MTRNEHGHFIGYDYRHWGQLYAQVRRGELWIWAPLYPQTQHELGADAAPSAFKVASIADAETLAAHFTDAAFIRDYVAGIVAVQQAFEQLPQEIREGLAREFSAWSFCCDDDAVKRYESLRKSAAVATWAPPPASKVLTFADDMATLVARAAAYERSLENVRWLARRPSLRA